MSGRVQDSQLRRRRARRDAVFRWTCAGALGLALLALGWVVGVILWRGVPVLADAGAGFLLSPDAPEAGRAGLATALLGSAGMVGLAVVLSIPAALVSAIYLQHFAPRRGVAGALVRALDVIINNLAAVPAIVFGLLGLAVFINGMGLARSAVLAGALVLALRLFPSTIIAARGSLASVPPQLADGARALGASHMQAVFGHSVPAAAPGMVTASLLALAQGLGEAAPLLLIGMVAYVSTPPSDLSDPATALPVQVYMWVLEGGGASADAALNSAAAGGDWAGRAAAATVVLLGVLLVINAAAAWLRRRLTRRSGP